MKARFERFNNKNVGVELRKITKWSDYVDEGQLDIYLMRWHFKMYALYIRPSYCNLKHYCIIDQFQNFTA